MSSVGVFAAVMIGIVTGWISERVIRHNHGLFINLIVAVIGSFLGAFIAGRLKIPVSGQVVSTLSAIILLAVLGLVGKRA